MSESTSTNKPILEVSIITGLSFLANTFITDPTHKTEALAAVPTVGGIAAYLLRRLGKYLRYKELREIEEAYLQDARAKRAQPELSGADIKRFDKEIASREQTLEQLRRDNLLF